MYSDLIIGFDGSPPARDALALARRLALATGARPTVLHARPYRALDGDLDDGADEMAWGAGVDRVLDAARALMADVPETTFEGVPDTSPARALHRAAEAARAALIVLGASHRSGVGRTCSGRRPKP